MKEIETLQRAKMYMDKLAQGIDPISGLELSDDTILNQVRLARCFFYVSGVLGKVIENGGEIGSKPKLTPFFVEPERLCSVPVSVNPIRITQFVEIINDAVCDSGMKKLSTTVITNWLLEKGFLEKVTGPDGKYRRLPTPNGILLGLSVQTRLGQYGEYQAVMYSADAQKFVLDHLQDMLTQND